jgi:putative membrane protein
MKNMFLVIKGFFMGIANVIPGVSGGTIAIILGIYEKFIDSISNLFKNLKENIKFLLPIFIGMGLAILTTSKVISYSYDKFPLPTLMFFVGLVFGGIPLLLKNVKGKKGSKSISNHIIFLLTFSLVIFLASYKFIFGIHGEVSFASMNFVSYLLLFIVGIVAAATMVIPGVSGSLVLMILGYYYPIINTINSLIKENFISNAFILGIFGLGVVVGIVAIAKLLELLFKKYKVKTYFGVLGFVFASIIAIPLSACIELNSSSTSVDQIVISIIMIVIGTIVSYNLGEK